MLCVKCAGPTKSLDTWKFSRYTARQRSCKACSLLFMTVETAVVVGVSQDTAMIYPEVPSKSPRVADIGETSRDTETQLSSLSGERALPAPVSAEDAYLAELEADEYDPNDGPLVDIDGNPL